MLGRGEQRIRVGPILPIENGEREILIYSNGIYAKLITKENTE